MGSLDLLTQPLGANGTETCSNDMKTFNHDDRERYGTPSGATTSSDEEKTLRLSFNLVRSLDADLGQTSIPPSSKMASQETMNTSYDDLPSLDVLKRQLSMHDLKRQESLKQITSGEECPTIAWFRNNHRNMQGRTMKRSMSVGCVVPKAVPLAVTPCPTIPSAAAEPTPSSKLDGAPVSPGRRSAVGTRRRRSNRLLTRCMSTPVITTSPRTPKKRSTNKKGITRCRTAPTRTLGQEIAYFNWEDWANKKDAKVEETATSACKESMKPFLSRRASMSSLRPTPEGSTLDQSFDWENHTKSLPLPDTSAKAASEVFDWKAWAKIQRGKDNRRRRTKRAASERTFHSCSPHGLHRQSSRSCRRNSVAVI